MKKRHSLAGLSFALFLLFLAGTPALAQKTWTGTTDTNWHNMENWSPVGVPTPTDDVVIPNTTNKPVINAHAAAQSVLIETGGMLTVSEGYNLDVNNSALVGMTNAGTLHNYGLINIGNTHSIGEDGFVNWSIFENKPGAVLTINRTGGEGIFNSNGSFRNWGEIEIGSIGAIDKDGIESRSTFINEAEGRIYVSRTNADGIDIESASFTNRGIIILGSVAAIAQDGIQNRSGFNNEGGTISIFSTGFSGIANLDGIFNNNSGSIDIRGNSADGIRNEAIFNNRSELYIGTVSGAMARGIDNHASFFNISGSMQINYTGSDGIYNAPGAGFYNHTSLSIGNLAPIGEDGIENRGTFFNTGGSITTDRTAYAGIGNYGTFNNQSGSIQLDGAGIDGIYNEFATFINQGNIAIGTFNPIVRNGIINFNSFSNNNGSIQIDNAGNDGISNALGTFTNKANITIGATGNIALSGVANIADFVNDGGNIWIDRATYGLYNFFGSFLNKGIINIGADTPISNALQNLAPFTNDACASIAVFGTLLNTDVFTNNGFLYLNNLQAHTNTGTFTNNGVIEYEQDNIIPGVINNGLIVKPISGECNNVPDALQIGTMNSFTVASIWYMDEDMINPAGYYEQATNVLEASGLPQGTTTVYFTITQADNNCIYWISTAVTLQDVTPPTIDCAAVNPIRFAAPGTCSFTVTGHGGGGLTPPHDDICAVDIVNDYNNSHTLNGASFPAGITPVLWTATDGAGNTASCTVNVTVIDDQAPTVQCFNQTVTFNGQTTILLQADDLAEAEDNCSVDSILLSVADISCEQLGQNIPVTVTVKDPSGNTASCTSTITVTGLPCGWSQNTNGVNCANGNNIAYNPANGVWTAISTNCFYGPPFTSDATAFAQRTLCGDGSIAAQVTSISGTALGWAGVVMRESNAAGAKKAQLMTNLSTLSRREFRTTTNGAANPQQFPSQNRYWLRIVRVGNQFSMYVSPNGAAWYLVGAQNIPMNACIQIGLVATNYQQNSTVTATFANVGFAGSNVPPLTGASTPLNTLNELTTDNSQKINDFQAYPNPTSGELNVDLAQYIGREARLEVYSLTGQLLRFVEIAKVQTTLERLDLSAFQSGIYLVKVKSDGLEDATRRIVVTR
ncbi:MAG: T9SS type A sorting domain-containing protein [Saprospiraceae bacterium]|nr:T9SS type A sorting domain-containing protein [Saprospiraceae bacterium]